MKDKKTSPNAHNNDQIDKYFRMKYGDWFTIHMQTRFCAKAIKNHYFNNDPKKYAIAGRLRKYAFKKMNIMPKPALNESS